MSITNLISFILIIFLTLKLEISLSNDLPKGVISIPFKKQIKDISSISPEDVVYPTLRNTAVTTELKFGTEPQALTLKIELVNYSFYIYGKEFENPPPIMKPSKTLIFDQTKSSTFEPLSEIISYKHQPLSFTKGFLASDYNFINNNKIKTNFIMATDINDEYSGGIGLRINESKIDEFYEYNFLKQLKNNNLINNYYFTFKYSDNNSGNLIIGDLPEKYDSEHYDENNFRDTYIEADQGADSVWNMKFDLIYTQYNNNTGLTEIKNSIGYFRTCMGVILGTEIYRKELLETFMKEEINKKNCFEEERLYYYTYYCKSNVDITKLKNLYFYNENLHFSFEFTWEDLFYKDEKTGNQYFLIIFDEEAKYWLLGEPFLRKYQIIFNQDQKRVGIYVQNKETKEEKEKDDNNSLSFFKKNKWYIILICILVVLLVSLIICLVAIFKYLKKRKKMANELDDEYDYGINEN